MFLKLFKIIILLVITTPVLSQEKIVFLDLDFLFKNSIKGKNIQQELENIDLNNVNILKEKENELKLEENQILSQKNILSDEAYNEKINNFKKKLKFSLALCSKILFTKITLVKTIIKAGPIK